MKTSNHSDVETEFDTAEQELQRALGSLAIEFGRLEHSVSEMVGAAFGMTDIPTVEAVNAVIGFRQKLDLIAALAPSRIVEPTELAQVRLCIKRLNEFEDQRNSLLHSFWAFDYLERESANKEWVQHKSRASRKNGLKPLRARANVESIRELAKEVGEYRNLFRRDGLYSAAGLLLKGARRT